MSFQYWEKHYASAQYPGEYDGWLNAYAHLLPAGSRVLDLGCGEGTNIPALLNFGVRLYGADLSRTAVGILQESYGAQLQAIDCFDMSAGFPYAENSFDAVIADLSLHYFSWMDTQRIIGELERILCPGGVLLARVHSMKNLDTAHAEKLDHGYYLAYGCLRRYFTQADLENLFSQWHVISLRENTAQRYEREKQVFEFAVQKKHDSLQTGHKKPTGP